MALYLPGPGPYFRQLTSGTAAGVVEAIVPLQTAAAVSSATLALTAPTTIVFGSARSYSTPILAAGPSLYWRLGASGTTDQSGNGRDGTGQAGITIGGQTGPLVGTTDQATDFDGSDDYISSAYSPFVAGSVRTFTGWANRDTSSSDDVIWSSSSGQEPILYLQSGTQTVRFSADASITDVNWAAAWPGNGQWVHWALIYDESGDTAALYINGALVSSQAHTTNYAASPGNLQVGIWSASLLPFDGKQAEFVIYDRALTATEILEHYNAGVNPPRAVAQSSASLALTTPARLILGRPYASVIKATSPGLYWTLDGITGATDQSGNGRDGTGVGGPSIGGFSGSPIAGETTSTDLDGTDDFVGNVSYSPWVNGTVRSFALWAYRDVSTATHVLIGCHGGPGAAIFINTGTQDVYFSSDNAAFPLIGTWPGNGQWVFCVVVFDESNDLVTLYINGVAGTPVAHTNAWGADTGIDAGAQIGALTFNGKLAHVSVFERALTPLEIWEFYNAGLLPPCAAQSSATLSIFTPKVVPLETAAAVSTATLVLTAQTTIPLATSAAVSTATLALSAKTTITLATSAAVSTGTLALTAPTYITLATSAAVSTGTLTLTAPAKLTLATAAAVSAGTLTLTAPALLSLTTGGQSSATLALTAQTKVVLGTSAAVSTATLVLTAQTKIVLGTSAAVSTATLALTAPGLLTLQTATAVSTGALSLTAQTYITLSNAVAISDTSLVVTIPGSSVVPLSIAAAISTATLTLAAQTFLILTADAVSTATLDLTAPFVGGGGVGLGMPVLMLVLDDDD